MCVPELQWTSLHLYQDRKRETCLEYDERGGASKQLLILFGGLSMIEAVIKG